MIAHNRELAKSLLLDGWLVRDVSKATGIDVRTVTKLSEAIQRFNLWIS